MTIILDPSIGSLTAYRQMKAEHQGQQRESGKQRLFVPKRPSACRDCRETDSFWVKSYYFRWVTEGDVEEVVCVPRYICRCCKLVVSVLFAFVVPYRHFTREAVSQATQDYVQSETSYRRLSGEHSDADGVRPSHATIWAWVDAFAHKAAKVLCGKLQRACVNVGREQELPKDSACVCVNAGKAKSLEKATSLCWASRLLMLALCLFGERQNFVEELQTYFVFFVQPALSILTGRALVMSAPQRLRHHW